VSRIKFTTWNYGTRILQSGARAECYREMNNKNIMKALETIFELMFAVFTGLIFVLALYVITLCF